ncbi:ScyD/ScyE family protein [Gloeothece verrucosa]|uniref:NHL repeat containing protein n=1 Tax=Gloeothece verrucosa (strain PCC 7822) TaxID=497965 RepID=E0UFZ9_GLOV7|nr:ScyD/ScyE family protein [Gloeothece verrucosa]ADN14382.1 conserved hypothetical protein [Gloeothece verrucosa PCC 7822]
MKLKSLKYTISLVTFGFSLVTGAAAQAASISVIATGLDNPRNLAFAPDGSIYVTESGKGGDGADGRCIPSPSAQYIPLCAGHTGKLSRITLDGQKQTLISNLPSLALTPSGEQAAGPADIKFDSLGNAYLLFGYAGDPKLRNTTLKEPTLGQLYKYDTNTKALSSIFDFAQYEIDHNPDGTDLITNPYALGIKDDLAYVVDGGGNTIYSIGLDGSGLKGKGVAAFPLQPLPSDAEFPPLPPGEGAPPFQPTLQSVPTGIAFAPDGSLTVSEYSAFPYPEGDARIFKVDPTTLQTQVLYNGFTQLTGVTYDDKGNLYALQHINQSEWKAIEQGGNIIGDISGSIIKIAPDGTRKTVLSGHGLAAASGLTFGPDGRLYTSNFSRLAGQGQILAIDPTAVPEPSTILGVVLFGVGARFFRHSLNKKQESDKD